MIFLLLSDCPASTSLSPTQNYTVAYFHEFKKIYNKLNNNNKKTEYIAPTSLKNKLRKIEGSK